MRWILLVPLVCLIMGASAGSMSEEYEKLSKINPFADMDLDGKKNPAKLSQSEEEEEKKKKTLAGLLGVGGNDDLLDTDDDTSEEKAKKKAVLAAKFAEMLKNMFADDEDDTDKDTCKSRHFF